MSDDEQFPISLYVYDLTHGMAKSMAPQLLGIPIEGIWHTSVVVHGKEYYFGQGIFQSDPGSTHHGLPHKVIDMGKTYIPSDVLAEFIDGSREDYTANSYSLFDHNCNHFSQHLLEFLGGSPMPQNILDLPQIILSTPFGQMLRPMIEQAMRPMVN